MAFINAEIKISTYGVTIPVSLYYPTDLPAEVGNKIKGVITLLHGFSNTGSDWMMYTSAARYAADNGYVLVAPSYGNSFGLNMVYGAPYYTILTEALPAQLRAIFHLPDEREKNFIAGLSMGGYAAMQIGLSLPQRYAAIGSFSAPLTPATLLEDSKTDPALLAMIRPVLGNEPELRDELDPMALVRRAAALEEAERPAVFVSCGNQDAMMNLISMNQKFDALAKTLPLRYAFKRWDGVHEFNFWDRSLAEFIGFIQNDGYGEKKCGDWR